jgi:hypothetical protein
VIAPRDYARGAGNFHDEVQAAALHGMSGQAAEEERLSLGKEIAGQIVLIVWTALLLA